MQKNLLRELCSEAGVDPYAVSYVELHGTGTVVGDRQEGNSVSEVFCGEGRSTPLLIGSVKSNMGHAEPASGLASLAKVLIAIHDRAIPANLHFKEPNSDIPGLLDGRLKVISNPLRFSSLLLRSKSKVTRCSAIAERARCRVRYSFRQK